jgi:hypothetical protein
MADIFIDFDGTICPNKTSVGDVPSYYPPPSDRCREVIRNLRLQGHRVIIYSVRSNKLATKRPTGHEEMVEYLGRYLIEYDGIECSKVHFTYIIDDKGCGVPLDIDKNVDWEGVQAALVKKNYIRE